MPIANVPRESDHQGRVVVANAEMEREVKEAKEVVNAMVVATRLITVRRMMANKTSDRELPRAQMRRLLWLDLVGAPVGGWEKTSTARYWGGGWARCANPRRRRHSVRTG